MGAFVAEHGADSAALGTGGICLGRISFCHDDDTGGAPGNIR